MREIIGYTILMLLATVIIPYVQAEPPAKVTISDPKNGAEVGKGTKVIGTAAVPPGEHLWLLVHNSNKTPLGYSYPQGEVEIDDETQVFAKYIQCGEASDIGDNFKILVITVNEQENARLHEALKKMADSGIWKYIKIPRTTSVPVSRKVTKVSHE